MFDWWFNDDWMMIDWLMIDWWFIDDWLMIDWWLIDDWLMTDWWFMGWPDNSFDCVSYIISYWSKLLYTKLKCQL